MTASDYKLQIELFDCAPAHEIAATVAAAGEIRNMDDSDPSPVEVTRETRSWASRSAGPLDLAVPEGLSQRQLNGAWQALSALRSAETLDQLLDEAPREICWRCGFHRAVLSRIEGSRLVALAAHFADSTEDAEGFLERARADPPAINALPIESEMIRRRLPVRVSGEWPEMTGDGSAAVSPSADSYVAAPVIAQKRVVGFIHADRSDAGPSLADSDRDALGALAEALAAALARVILLERLRRQRVIVRGQLVSIEALLDEAESPIEIAAPDEAGDDLARIAAGMFVAPESRAKSPDALLTRRELEVLGLMAAGATNAGIADRLVISETTVKSHVQHILRKLRASNRAEAVSLYFRRTAGQR